MTFNPEKFIVGRKVSKPLSPEGTFLDVTEAGLLFVIRRPDITPEMIRDIMRGVAQFRLGAINGVLIFLARFGMLPWFNANFHRGFSSYEDFQPPTNGAGYSLYVFLVDSKTGVLRAKQLFVLRREISKKFFDLFNQQESQPPHNWDILIKRVYRKHTITQLAALLGMDS